MNDGITSLATFQENGMTFFEGMMDFSNPFNTLILISLSSILTLGTVAKKCNQNNLETNMKP